MENLSLEGIVPAPRPALPVIGEQGDITYRSTLARSVLNPPESTGMGYWSINPYIGCAFGCAYCYARYAHRYALDRASHAREADPRLVTDVKEMPAWLAFERRILVKENAADVLRKALRYGGEKHLGLVKGESLVIGTATDPYQPAERRFRVTRGILEVLAEHPGLRVAIITKSPLVTRDADLLVRIARYSRVTVHISLITADRDLARRLEPRSPTPESRLRAVARLRDAGVDAGVFCMPVLPGITDRPRALESLVKAVAESGATHFVAGSLRLRSTARQRYIPVIASEFPELLHRYEAAYRRSYDLPKKYRDGLRSFVTGLCRRFGIPSHHARMEESDHASEEEAPDAKQLELWE